MPVTVTEDLLEHRRLLGLDKKDERWAGEWRIVNPPKYWHVAVQADLLIALHPRAKDLGLQVVTDGGVFGADDDWRVPDLVVLSPRDLYGDAGVARAELVVEIRSPGDDSYKKLPFYALHAHEVLILHRDRTVELHRSDGEGGIDRVAPAADGSVHCQALDVTFRTVDGPLLRIEWDGGAAVV